MAHCCRCKGSPIDRIKIHTAALQHMLCMYCMAKKDIPTTLRSMPYCAHGYRTWPPHAVVIQFELTTVSTAVSRPIFRKGELALIG